jgi:hypothetical protein
MRRQEFIAGLGSAAPTAGKGQITITEPRLFWLPFTVVARWGAMLCTKNGTVSG